MKPHDPRPCLMTAACLSALALTTLTFAPPALAQHDHEHHVPARTQTAPIASGQGVVKKIDPAKQRLTLQHDPIPALGWPAMTMPFTITDPALLQGLEIGDKVEFDLKDEQTISAMRKR